MKLGGGRVGGHLGLCGVGAVRYNSEWSLCLQTFIDTFCTIASPPKASTLAVSSSTDWEYVSLEDCNREEFQ